MTTSNFSATVHHLAARLTAEHATLAQAWLERLDQLLDVDRRDVFPTHQLLDHIPALLREVAAYLRAPAEQEIAANTAIMAKAAELGLLRFDQRASVHQVLREYQLLSDLLEGFFAREVAALGERADATAAVLVVSRASQAVRELQRKTVDAFITRFSETIERQHGQLRGFGRLVSHEIRQPLGVLQVLTRLLHEGDPADAPRLVAALDRNVRRLADVAGKLERLARLTRSESSPNDQRVDLAAISRDVALQLADMAEVRGVVFDIDEALPSLTADAGRVELVLMNLMANAVKYCDPGKAGRFVRVRVDDREGRRTVRVEDNGLGIPATKRAIIFEQFERAHAHLDDEIGAQGLGLGLSIVRECMDAMGGTVTVESHEHDGAAFILTWPPLAWGPA